MHKVPLVTIVDTPSDRQFLCFPCYHGHLYHPVQEKVDWMGGTITKQSTVFDMDPVPLVLDVRWPQFVQ